MFFRIVTRGLNPLLVQQNALQAITVLDACLPRSMYVVEVLTDNAIDVAAYLQEHFHPADGSTAMLETNFSEIVVPSSYQCESGAKYKARALHYAIIHGQCRDQDWIIHLDEETRFTAETAQYCLQHCLREDRDLKSGKKTHANIGQGVIYYGCNRTFENYITTLADSARVADDYGKFRIQYETHYPWIGMHGSFVVCTQAVERMVGFDNGLKGSITEDAYFALVAWAKGVQFSWIDAYMYEQSPFSISDFIMQRRRWFGGLWLVCREASIPLQYRLTLLLMVITWAGSPIPVIANSLSLLIKSSTPNSLVVVISFTSAVFCWNYLLGFLKTFDIRDGVIRYFVLMFMQIILQPVFAAMELAGVIAAIISPPVKGFHIVKKEGKNVIGDTTAK